MVSKRQMTKNRMILDHITGVHIMIVIMVNILRNIWVLDLVPKLKTKKLIVAVQVRVIFLNYGYKRYNSRENK